MKKTTLPFFFMMCLFVLGFICFPSKLNAQNGITGTVFSDVRRPIAEIDIELLDQFERFIKSEKTRSSGLYFFNNLSAGVYFVQVRTAGTNFSEQKIRVSLGDTNRTVQTSSGSRTTGVDVQQINILLEINPRRQNRTPSSNVVVFAQDIPNEAERAYKKGLTYAESEKTSLAIEEFRKATDIFPLYYSALIELGKLYLIKSQFENAAEVFETTVKVNNKSVAGFYGLTIAQNSLNNKAEAEANLLKAIELESGNISYHLLLGIIQRDLRKFSDAEKNFLKANSLSEGKEPDIHWNLALLYLHNLQRYNDAANQIELYLKLSPKMPQEKKDLLKKLVVELRQKAQAQ